MLKIKKIRYRILCFVIAFLFFINYGGLIVNTYSEEQSDGLSGISSESVILMEASTGTVIYEKDSDKQLPPASITKIMTLILIFEAIDDGKISFDETVTVSEHAASMGGSQVFLEPMEQQTVDTMIKCIAVASANDACVAMAEHIAGTEENFVIKMNEKAKELGMTNTNFINCCGLDVDGHITSARDVAIMSRELITKHPKIFEYSGIWMENIIHSTSKGDKEFGLTNTNKLIKQYQYATGLKTGSTSKAKYCVSATAKKDGIELIAVVMAAPDYKVRFKDAAALLDYGFANCTVYKDDEMPKLKPVKVKNSLDGTVEAEYGGEFSYISVNNEKISDITKKKNINECKAPIKKGDKIGELVYYSGENKIGKVDIIAKNTVKQADFVAYLKLLLNEFVMN